MLLRAPFAVLIALAFGLAAFAGAVPRDKKPPKPSAARPAAKPARKPAAPARNIVRPTPQQAHRPVVPHAHWTTHRAANLTYAGHSARLRTWYYHHHHQRWVYQVRYRIGGTGKRIFTNRAAAQTFRVWLWRHQLRSNLHVRADGTWSVTYWGSHVHRFGTYASLPVARRVEIALREYGFPSWVYWLQVYF
jgi:hypothetical protein